MKTFLICMLVLSAESAEAAQPAVSAGRYHNLGLTTSGEVLSWGAEPGMSEMLGKRVPASTPRRVAGLPSAIAVAAGWAHSSAITHDGSVYEWGFSPYKVRQVFLMQPLLGPCMLKAILMGGHGVDPCAGAQYARASRMRVVKPMRIPGVPPAIAVAANDASTAVVTRNGDVYCWSQGSFPRKLEGLSDITAIALGQFHGVALRKDGVVLGWGSASANGISYATSGAASLCEKPEAQAIFTGATAIAASADTTYALRADGSVWAWGAPWNGGPAMPKEDNVEKPDRFLARRIAILDGAVELGGGRHPSARTKDGLVTSWVNDYEPGATSARTRPSVSGIAALSSYSSVLALTHDGFVWTMGENMSGTTVPGNKAYEIKTFTPVVLDDARPLNLIDQKRAVPPELCQVR